MKSSSEKLVLGLWVVASPLLLEWGVGASRPSLDLLSIPGAFIVGLPASLGLPGLGAFCLLTLLSWRGLVRGKTLEGALALARGVAALSLIATCLALTRPLLLLAFLPIVLSGLRAPGSAVWTLAPASSSLAAVLCWGLCLVLPPAGRVFLGDLIEGPLLELLIPVAGSSRQVLSLCILGLVIVGLSRRSPPDRLPLIIGCLAGLLLDMSFGTPVPALYALGIGAILGGWSLPIRPSLLDPVRLALPVAALAGLVGLSTGLSERWLCPGPDTEELRFLSRVEDVSDIAMSLANLPFILLLGEDPPRFERVLPTVGASESVVLEHSEGQLFSIPGLGGKFVRLVDGEPGAHVEWWRSSTLELLATVALPADCNPHQGIVPEGSTSLVVSCGDGRLIRLEETGGEAGPVGNGDSGLDGYSANTLPVRAVGGPLSRFALESSLVEPAEAIGPLLLGPWSGQSILTPGGLFVGRGPVGQIEIRGEDPLWAVGIGAPRSKGTARRLDEARNVLDRIRVPGWPSDLLWSPRHPALWVTSANSGDISLVDAQVTWHRRSLNVGPVPRRTVVDPISGQLYGVNRCGLFEARISSVFPWDSGGDMKDEVPTPSPVGLVE